MAAGAAAAETHRTGWEPPARLRPETQSGSMAARGGHALRKGSGVREQQWALADRLCGLRAAVQQHPAVVLVVLAFMVNGNAGSSPLSTSTSRKPSLCAGVTAGWTPARACYWLTLRRTMSYSVFSARSCWDAGWR
ncbi:hypothetical protein B0H14DRAFT_2648370 [Mycena olivaceomarginata]|nr:hypothetical protein B0H14DRAFT_2648370 [Mycena olivaceomarginata]